MTERARIVGEPLRLAEEIRAALRDSDGAVATFVGVVRNENEGLPVDAVEYSAYAPMAERELARIEEELARDYPDTLTRVRHRIGTLRVGEESVAIVSVSPHRARAFAACRAAIERVKERVPIWKRELGAGREPSWVDARTGAGTPRAGDIVRSMEDGK